MQGRVSQKQHVLTSIEAAARGEDMQRVLRMHSTGRVRLYLTCMMSSSLASALPEMLPAASTAAAATCNNRRNAGAETGVRPADLAHA